MRWPAMITPLPVASAGACLVQGFATSGRRMVENTFTTADSATWLMVSSGAALAAIAPVALARRSSDRRTLVTLRVMGARLCSGWVHGTGADFDTETAALPFPPHLTYLSAATVRHRFPRR